MTTTDTINDLAAERLFQRDQLSASDRLSTLGIQQQRNASDQRIEWLVWAIVAWLVTGCLGLYFVGPVEIVPVDSVEVEQGKAR